MATRQKQNVIGEKYGRLTIIGELEHNGRSRKVIVKCECQISTIKSVLLSSLKNGETKSCGCWSRESAKLRATTHGMTKHPLYRIWAGIIKRCTNPKNHAYKNYGGRNIIVCEEWRKFENFYADMHKTYKAGLSIDRIDNDKGYSKDNCQWATNAQQVRNRRMTIFITMNGETKCVKDWATQTNVDYKKSIVRIHKGESPYLIFNIEKNEVVKS